MERIILVQEEPRGPSMLVEIPVPAQTVQRVQLPDIQQLRSTQNSRIVTKAIRCIPDTVLTNAVTLNGVNAPLTELQKITLVIYCEGWEKAQYIPILTLVDTFTEGSGIPYKEHTAKFDDWINVDWSKSYLQYANGTQSVGTAYNVLLEVQYVKLGKDNMPIVGPGN